MISPSELPHLGPLRLPEQSIVRSILRRTALAFGLILLLVVVLWLDRDGLQDSAKNGGPPGLVDVFYYAVVSLSTVGYGDISPVTTEARLVNALVLTPIRLFVWVVFLGTAYELTVLRLRLREDRQMQDLHDRLNHHVIVCGYGVKGRAIVDEMIAVGQPREQIVVIDPADAAIEAASGDGLAAFRGDASSENLLKSAAVEKASAVMAAPNRDDACVLICLTVRALAPNTRIIAAAREEENIKLLYNAGATLVVSPSVTGGRVMASAMRQTVVPAFLEDLISGSTGLVVHEYQVPSHEAGLRADQLDRCRGRLVLGVSRDGRRYPFHEARELPLQADDIVVVIDGGAEREPTPPGPVTPRPVRPRPA